MSYFTTNPAICDGYIHGFSTLHEWERRLESYKAYNGCVGYLYDEIDWLGTEYGPVDSALDLGQFNNRARSLLLE